MAAEAGAHATLQIAAEAFPQMPAPAAATSPFHFLDFLNGNDQMDVLNGNNQMDVLNGNNQMDVLNGNEDLPPQPQMEHPHPDPAVDVAPTDELFPTFPFWNELDQFQFSNPPAADFPGWGIYPPPLLV